MTKRRAPRPPADLKPDAKARWTAVYPTLRARGPVDLALLRTYCQVWGRWREAEDGIAKAGQLTKGPGGRIVASPLLDVSQKASLQVQALERRLGLGLPGPDTGPSAGESGGGLITRRELAERLGQHPMTITKWERDGMPIAQRGARGRPSFYSEADVRAWKDARDERALDRPGHVDVAQQRARKERAQAVLAEQTYQARQRELLPVAEVERAWNAEVQAVRAAILATYTTQADRLHRVAILDGVSGLEAELKELAHALLRELANHDRDGAQA